MDTKSNIDILNKHKISIKFDINKDKLSCYACKSVSTCRSLCQDMAKIIEKAEIKQAHLERNIDDFDLLGKKMGPLKLSEMETDVLVVKPRKAVNVSLASEDFAPVAAAGLSEKQQFVIHRHFWQRKTVRQIAGEMGVSHAAVGALLKRGQRRLGLFLYAQGAGA